MDPLVTVVVVPRERFSLSERSLETLYANTDFPFRLVYVCAGAPARVRHYMEREARQRSFQLICTDRYLSPNQVRNLGVRQVKTRYVVFLDNDALVAPGCLEALVGCAEETGAWVVAPLYLIGEFSSRIIHMAGGVARFVERQGQRILYDQQRLMDVPLDDLSEPLRREACDFSEFHCALLRTDVFEKVGPLDEQLLSLHEHVDLGLTVRRAGGSVYFEPGAVVTYIPPSPPIWSDLPYFHLRWCEAWNLASVRHFKEKWGLSGLRSTQDPLDDEAQDSTLRVGRGLRRVMTGLRVPPDGKGDRPESPLEEAEVMAALFQSVDRDTFDLTLTNQDGDMVETFAALDPQAFLERLPQVLQTAEEGSLNVTIRPLAVGRANEPALIRLDGLDADGLARVRAHAFLSLQTSPQTYQCWLAVSRGRSRTNASLREVVGAVAATNGSAHLAGTRIVNAEQRLADGSYPRVRLVEGHTGLLKAIGELKGTELLPYLWAGQLS